MKKRIRFSALQVARMVEAARAKGFQAGQEAASAAKNDQIEVVKTVVNGNSMTTYNGKKYLDVALEAIYGTQGEFYRRCYGVSQEDAEAAGWGPKISGFSRDCMSWNKFLAEKGTITKTVTIKAMDPCDLI